MKTQIAAAAVAVLFVGCTSMRENMGSAEPITLNQMPAAVQDTVRNEIGNQTIARITEETKYGQPAYRIEVEAPGINPTLWVSSDGSILKESRRLVTQEGRAVREPAGAEPSTMNGVNQNEMNGSRPVGAPPPRTNGTGVHSGQDY